MNDEDDISLDAPKRRRQSRRAPANDRPWLCAYQVGGLFCPLPGSLSPDTGPKPARNWYCWLHIDDRPQGAAAHQDLMRIIERQAALLRERKTRATEATLGLLWDPIAQEYTYAVAKSTIARWPARTAEAQLLDGIDRNPEWQRGPQESSSEYAARMIGIMRGLAGRIVKPLPYDPTTRLAREEAAEERAAIQGESG